MVDEWGMDDQGRAIVSRQAEHWERIGQDQIQCKLCYRECKLDPGEAGWCKARVNNGGVMELTSHGVLSGMILQQRGYQVDPFMTYKTGALSLFIGGVHCTSGCTFCMSKEITWRPEKTRWFGWERGPAFGLFFGYRGMVHPAGMINLAKMLGCSQVEFGINEPLLTYEYTFDTARLAYEAGLDVVIETNGFSNPEIIREIAPFVAAVDLGVKGSLDPEFYGHWMKSPSATNVVKESALAWRKAGVHLIIGDVIAPMQMQSDQAFEKSTLDFYSWIRDYLGNLSEILITPLLYPGANPSGNKNGYLLPASATEMDESIYTLRLHEAVGTARDLGLHYAHHKIVADRICCHNCGAELLSFISPSVYCEPCLMPHQFCDQWDVIFHVDKESHCENCGAWVPVVPLSAGEQERAKESIKNVPEEVRYKGQVFRRNV